MFLYIFSIFPFLRPAVPQLDYSLQEDSPLVCSKPGFSYVDLPKAAWLPQESVWRGTGTRWTLANMTMLESIRGWSCSRHNYRISRRASRSPAKICTTFLWWLLAQAGTHCHCCLNRSGNRNPNLGGQTTSFTFRCTYCCREPELWMNTQAYGYAYCDVSLYNKCMQKMQTFAWVSVSAEFMCGSALEKPKGDWLDIGHCWNEYELFSTYSSTLWALWTGKPAEQNVILETVQ